MRERVKMRMELWVGRARTRIDNSDTVLLNLINSSRAH